MVTGVLLASFPPHGPELEYLRQEWASYKHFNKGILGNPREIMPMDEIRDYFGEKISLYFGYLGFYTRMLVLPALVGTFVALVQLIQGFDYGYVIPVYAVLIVIWSGITISRTSWG